MEQPRPQISDFDEMLQHVIAKMKAHQDEITKAKRTRLTVHRSATGRINVELETKL